MKKNYQKYSLEDFTQDRKFIRWVNTGEGSEEWQDFIKDNPQLKKNVEVAHKIIKLLQSNNTVLLEEEIYDSWKNVEHFYNLYHNKKRKTLTIKLLKYAAIIVFILSIGAAIPYFYFKSEVKSYSEIVVSSEVKEPKLILSDGNEIILNEEKNALHFNLEGEVKINNDSIIKATTKDLKSRPLTQLILPYGKIKSDLVLSDGTKVWINAGSTLKFPQKFGSKERRVFLRGEAYFEVSENSESPFIVNANEISVTVLGTSFNIKNDEADDELEVVLVEGSVSLKENRLISFLSKEIKLTPNQRAVYNKTNNETEVVSNINTEYYTSWKDGLLQFNRESILNVFKRMSRFYNVNFITEPNVELHRKISGKLDLKESLEDVLTVVSDATPITYRIVNDTVYVYEKPYYLPMK